MIIDMSELGYRVTGAPANDNHFETQISQSLYEEIETAVLNGTKIIRKFMYENVCTGSCNLTKMYGGEVEGYMLAFPATDVGDMLSIAIMKADNAYTLMQDVLDVAPTPPTYDTENTYVLKCVAGVVQWVEETT